jgi:hypothetical protein
MPTRRAGESSRCGWRCRASATRLLSIALLVLCTGASAAAHDLSISQSRVTVKGSTATVRLSIDLMAFAGVDANADARVSHEELERSIERVFALVKQHYQVTAGGPARRITLDRYELADEHGVDLDLRYAFDGDVRRVEVTSTLDSLAGPSHQHVVSVDGGEQMQRAVLSANSRTAAFDGGGSTVGQVITGMLAAAGVTVLLAYRILSGRSRARPRAAAK